MIIRAGQVPSMRCENIGQRSEEQIGPAGGLKRLGVNVVTLMPGETSTWRHWHEAGDEFLLLLEGRAVVVENDGPHELGRGDTCCWPEGVPNAHHVLNRSDAPVRYLVVGQARTATASTIPTSGRPSTTSRRAGGWRTRGAASCVRAQRTGPVR